MSHWWEEPYRLVQTNLRETDAQLDPRRLVRRVKELHGNVVLFNVGGIVAFYPTQLALHERSEYLRGDILREVLDEAHAQGVRLVGRFDLSKAGRRAYEEHPDWFVRTASGSPVVYNGKYQTCVNGGWQRDYSMKILDEALSTYELDGVFFNMFGYQTRDYSGNYHGICRCGACRSLFAQASGGLLPGAEDPEDPVFRRYLRFQRETTAQLAERVYEKVKSVRPATGAMLRFRHSDIIRMEVNRSVDRALPDYPHWSGEQAKWAESFGGGKAHSSTIVHFIDFPWRFAGESGACQALRLAQQISNGGQPDYYVVGTVDQEDESAYPAVRALFKHHEDHSDLYRATASAAEVALYHSGVSERLTAARSNARPGGSSHFRGMYRILSETHTPFDVLTDDQMQRDEAEAVLGKYRLVVLANAACLSARECELLDRYVERGGRLIATHETALYDENGDGGERYRLESLGVTRVERRRSDLRGSYFRVGDQELSLPGVGLMLLDGQYLYAARREGARERMSLLPPQRFGPPEKCYPDLGPVGRPAVISTEHGAGRTAYLPWEPDALYYRHSLKEHRAVIADLLRSFQPDPPVVLDAPTQLEVTVRRQVDPHRTVVHLVNFSGHQGTAYEEPIPLHGVRLALRVDAAGAEPGRAHAVVAGRELRWRSDHETADDFPAERSRVTTTDEDVTYVACELPPIGQFEVVTIDHAGQGR